LPLEKIRSPAANREGLDGELRPCPQLDEEFVRDTARYEQPLERELALDGHRPRGAVEDDEPGVFRVRAVRLLVHPLGVALSMPPPRGLELHLDDVVEMADEPGLEGARPLATGLAIVVVLLPEEKVTIFGDLEEGGGAVSLDSGPVVPPHEVGAESLHGQVLVPRKPATNGRVGRPLVLRGPDLYALGERRARLGAGDGFQRPEVVAAGSLGASEGDGRREATKNAAKTRDLVHETFSCLAVRGALAGGIAGPFVKIKFYVHKKPGNISLSSLNIQF